MGKPAARLGDMHMCPMVTPGVPPVPHVGGPVASPGAPTVLIGSMPVATVGSICTCVGPPDSIVMGSFGVLMGKKPAARMGDQTVHGGTVAVGLPTVLIGDVSAASLAVALTIVLRMINASNSTINCGNIIDAVAAFLRGQGIATVSGARDGSWAAINTRFGTNLNFGRPTTINTVFNDLQSRGPGSMTLIGVSYASGGSHVIVAANVNGEVGILEGQTWNQGQPNEQPRGFITSTTVANNRYNSGGTSTITASPIP